MKLTSVPMGRTIKTAITEYHAKEMEYKYSSPDLEKRNTDIIIVTWNFVPLQGKNFKFKIIMLLFYFIGMLSCSPTHNSSSS